MALVIEAAGMSRLGAVGRARENVTGIVSMLVTGTWLAALVTGQDWWLPFMLVGYVVIVPLVAILFDDEAKEQEWSDGEAEGTTAEDLTTVEAGDDEALSALRERYARGELTDEQFERKLDRLIEFETVEDVEDRERTREEPERS